MNQAIEINNLVKRFDTGSFKRQSVLAVDDISLSIEVGEAFGFIGPNGAGKSTTIKMLTGSLNPTSGSAKIFGVSINDPQARLGLGYVPENPSLYDYLTPLEILTMSVRLHQVELADHHAHCMEWLERLQLAHVANKMVRSFSKGMAQRVALAQALCIKPRLLVLDEPLSGLDPLGRRDVVNILAEYRRTGGTLFFSSHVLYDVERLADRFGLIHQGKLRAVCSPAELVDEDDRVVIRSQNGSPLPGQQEDSFQRWSIEVAQNRLWENLELLRNAGQTLIEVKPAMSLETAFIKAVGHDGLG